MSKPRPQFSAFKSKALSDASVKAEYDALSPVYEVKRKMIAMRKAQGKTQKQMAELLGETSA